MKFLEGSSAVLFLALLAAGCHSPDGSGFPMNSTDDVSEAVHGALDGQRYDIEFHGLDGASQGKSRLTFANGTFDSSYCRAHGFGPCAYSASKEMDGVHFAATARSQTNGTNAWQGTVFGGRIDGTVVSTDTHGLVDRCRFSGRMPK